MQGIPHYTNSKKLHNTGAYGEQLAVEYLESQSYKIIDRNAYSRWGEIDIVSEKKNKIHFVEVKTRFHMRQGMPYEAVRIPKLTHLMRTIQYYILKNNLHTRKFQLDVISIILLPDSSVKELKLYENIAVDRFF